MRAAPEISFRKTVTTGNTFLWHGKGGKTCLVVWHIQSAQWTQSVTSDWRTMVRMATLFEGEWWLCSSWHTKWLHSKPNCNYGGDEWTLEFLSHFFQTLEEVLEETEPGPSVSQLALSQLSKEFKHYFPTTKTTVLNWKGMGPWPICGYIRWVHFVHTRRGSATWDCKW